MEEVIILKLTYNIDIPQCVLCNEELTYLDHSRCRNICYACDVKRIKETVADMKKRLFPKVG